MGVDDFLKRLFLMELRQITRRITYLCVEIPSTRERPIQHSESKAALHPKPYEPQAQYKAKT